MKLLLMLLNPAIIGILSVFLAAIWMLRNEKDKTRPLLVIALVINLFYGFLLTVVLGREDSLLPDKYDFVLARIDQALGLPAAAIAPHLQGPWRVPLFIIYQLMVPMMIVWFLVARDELRRNGLVTAYVAEMIAGPMMYAVLPACGPLYAFKGQWLHPPDMPAVITRFNGMPNAFPSLHVATALIFVFFARGWLPRTLAAIFLAATVLATLSTGEHYAIDLVAGLAFGCFAVFAGRRQVWAAAMCLAVVITWSVTIRFGYQMLITHPMIVAAFAALTVSLAFGCLIRVWRAADEPLAQPLVEQTQS